VKAGSALTVEHMVELGRVSRSCFYRFDDAGPHPDHDMDLRDAIQKIALEWPSYGRPRITKELRRRGWRVNPKRVYRLMREDNLLCVRRRKFIVTTDSNHTRKVYPVRPDLANADGGAIRDQLASSALASQRLSLINPTVGRNPTCNRKRDKIGGRSSDGRPHHTRITE
jgi:hypothetical protein